MAIDRGGSGDLQLRHRRRLMRRRGCAGLKRAAVLVLPWAPMATGRGRAGSQRERVQRRISPGNTTTNSWERRGDAPRRRRHGPPARSARPFRYCTGLAKRKASTDTLPPPHRHRCLYPRRGAGRRVAVPRRHSRSLSGAACRGGDDAGVRVECSVPPSETLLHWLAKREKPRNSARQRKALTTHSDGRGVHKRPSVVGKRLPCLARARGSVMGHAFCAVGHAVSVTGTRQNND
jgi:hypothetical protein